MILLTSNDTLQVLLGGVVAANQCDLSCSYVDMAADGSTFSLGNSDGVTNGATAVSWMSAPAPGQVRQVKYLSLYNADTASVTVTVRKSNANNRVLCKVLLAPGERLEYTVDGGFRTTTSSVGTVVTSVNGSSGAVTLPLPSDIIVALGDETTALTVGTAKVTIRAPRAMTLSKVKVALNVASTSGLPQFDVKKNGTTIFTTKPTIDVSEKTTETAATPAALSTTAIAADDELTFDIVAAGTGAAGAKITLVATAP
jgi:hypothetical protein